MQLLNLSTQLKQLQWQSSQILRMLYVIISTYIIIVYVCCILYYYFMYINFMQIVCSVMSRTRFRVNPHFTATGF